MSFGIEGGTCKPAIPVQQEAVGPPVDVRHQVTHGLTWKDMNPERGRVPIPSSETLNTSLEPGFNPMRGITWGDLNPGKGEIPSSGIPDTGSESAFNPMADMTWRQRHNPHLYSNL